jgi:hypothetical protein
MRFFVFDFVEVILKGFLKLLRHGFVFGEIDHNEVDEISVMKNFKVKSVVYA